MQKLYARQEIEARDKELIAVISPVGVVLWPPGNDVVKGPQPMGELHDYYKIQDETVKQLEESIR